MHPQRRDHASSDREAHPNLHDHGARTGHDHGAPGFWCLGPLPTPPPESPACGLDLVGRPEISVDGRNLADVLRPAYQALTRDP